MPRKAGPAAKREPVNDVVRERCRIVGKKEIFGHKPGTTAELTLTRPQLDVLIKAGLVEVIAAPATAVAKHKKENGDGQVGSA